MSRTVDPATLDRRSVCAWITYISMLSFSPFQLPSDNPPAGWIDTRLQSNIFRSSCSPKGLAIAKKLLLSRLLIFSHLTESISTTLRNLRFNLQFNERASNDDRSYDISKISFGNRCRKDVSICQRIPCPLSFRNLLLLDQAKCKKILQDRPRCHLRNFIAVSPSLFHVSRQISETSFSRTSENRSHPYGHLADGLGLGEMGGERYERENSRGSLNDRTLLPRSRGGGF